jgi:glycosyltransferase involved in cell wall biosynthesis
MNQPLVSIVVTTKNEEKNIEACLLSIKNQTYKNIELILIDNDSTDRTFEIAQKYTNQVHTKGPERSAQRNMGLIELARGQFGMYLDADMTITRNLVHSCVVQMQTENCIGLYLPERVIGNSFFAEIRKFERTFYDATPIDAIRFFRLSDFRKIGGFDSVLFEKGSGEDWDLNLKFLGLGTIELLKSNNGSQRSNNKDDFDSYTGIHHNESEDRLIPYLMKKRYYAVGFKGYRERWFDHPHQQMQFSPYYRFFKVFVENGKWRLVLRHPIKFSGVVILKLLIGVITLDKLRK